MFATSTRVSRYEWYLFPEQHRYLQQVPPRPTGASRAGISSALVSVWPAPWPSVRCQAGLVYWAGLRSPTGWAHSSTPDSNLTGSGAMMMGATTQATRVKVPMEMMTTGMIAVMMADA